MTLRLNRHRKDQGSVLVLCAVLAALGTLGVIAWASLIQARSNQVEASYEALKRRAALQSSKELARDAFYTNHLHTDAPVAAATTYAVNPPPTASTDPGYISETIAAATIRSYTPVPLTNTTTTRTTKSGVGPLRSFTTDVIVDVSDNRTTYPLSFQLRAAHPVLGGELLTMYPPVVPDSTAPLVSGNLSVNGRAVFWDAGRDDYGAGLRADEVILPNHVSGTTTFTSTSGGAVLPSNYPIPRQTTGFASGVPAYRGELDIIRSTSNQQNTYETLIRNTSNFREIDGATPRAFGIGPDTIDTNDAFGRDQELMQKIDYAAAGDSRGNGIASDILSRSPSMSSRVLIHAMDNPTAFAAGELFNILDANDILANDTLSKLADENTTVLTWPQMIQIFDKCGVWAWCDGDYVVHLHLYMNTAQNLIMTETDKLVVVGPDNATDAAALQNELPLAFSLANSTTRTLDSVELFGQSQRRFALGIAHESATPVQPTLQTNFDFAGSIPFPEWHVILDLQNTGANLNATPVNTARLIGGIRANRPVNVTGGTVSLEQQYFTDDYAPLLPRNAWVETYTYLAP